MTDQLITIKTRVKSISLETSDDGTEVEKCMLVFMGTPNEFISTAYLIMDFVRSGRGSLHVGQEIELSIFLREK